MHTKFREKKATEATAYLLSLNRGKMNYTKLIKLLYLADRFALIHWGRPITYDYYYLMKMGPVLSEVYDLINHKELYDGSYWKDYISEPENYTLNLRRESELYNLSNAEVKLLNQIFDENKNLSWQDLVKKVHELPESPQILGGAKSIEIRDILNTTDRTEIEKDAIIEELEEIYRFERSHTS